MKKIRVKDRELDGEEAKEKLNQQKIKLEWIKLKKILCSVSESELARMYRL